MATFVHKAKWFVDNADTVITSGDVHFLEGTHNYKTGDGNTKLNDLNAFLFTPYLDAPADSQDYARNNNEWVVVTGGSGIWGSITGTLSDQTDLQAELDTKTGFTLTGTWGSTNPADSTTYYASSGANNAQLVTGRTNIASLYIPIDCVLKSVKINVICGAASGETVTYNIDVNSVGTLIATNASTSTNFIVQNNAMSVTCLQSEKLYLEIVAPAWATNPTSHRGCFTCYFELV